MSQGPAIAPLNFSLHALAVMAERGIKRAWVERVLGSPEWTESDPTDATLRRAFGRVQESGGRVLRVVYHETKGARRVVTVFFDRRHRRGEAKERS